MESNAKSHFINRLDNHSQLEVISCAKCVKAIYDAIVCFAGGLSSGIFDSVAVGFKFFDYSICDGFTIICGRFIVEIGYPEAHTPIYHIRNIASEVDVELIYPTGFIGFKLAAYGRVLPAQALESACGVRIDKAGVICQNRHPRRI